MSTHAPLEGRPRFGIAAALFGLLILQGIYSARLPLFGDEAYYWVWGQHLDLSYFDHPPMIAWMLHFATRPAISELTVRLVPEVCFGLSAWFIYALARDIYGEHAGRLALVIFLVMPATQIGVLVATPDAPLLLFWCLAMFAGYRAIVAGGWGWHVLTGLAVGLALLSKYTAVLFPAALLTFLAIRRRGVLARGETWLAMAVAALVFAPVVLWNFRHDWISFAFQYHHGSSGDGGLQWGLWLEFLAGTFAIFSPVLLILALMAAFAEPTRRDDRRLYLAALFVLPLAFFAYKGLFSKMELNWVAIAFPAGTILVAGFVSERRLRAAGYVGLALALATSLAIKFPVALGVPAKWNPLNRLYANREAVEAILELRRPGEPLLANHYTTAALLSFYAPDHPPVAIPTVSRYSQYDLWAAQQPPSKPRGLYLGESDKSEELAQQCGSASSLRVFTVSTPGFAPKTFYFYRCG